MLEVINRVIRYWLLPCCALCLIASACMPITATAPLSTNAIVNQPTVTTTPLLATPTLSFESTRLPFYDIPELKVAFRTLETIDGLSKSSLWVVSLPAQTAQPILTTQYIDDSTLAWSRDGKRIAYVHRISNGQEATISIINVDSLLVSPIELSVRLGGGAAEFITLYPSLNWSSNDVWLYFVVKYSDQTFKQFVANTTDRRVHELNPNWRFLGWSPSAGEVFLYVDMMNNTINLRNINSGDQIVLPRQDIDLRTTGTLAWSPTGDQAVLSASDSENAFTPLLLLLNFTRRETRSLLFAGQIDPVAWSPNGSWIAMWNSDLFFLDARSFDRLVKRVSAKSDSIDPKVWLSDSRAFVYQDGQTLYVVSPWGSEPPQEILNLTELGIKSDSEIVANVWSSLSP